MLPRAWLSTKKFIHHFWWGTKLLITNLYTSTRLLNRVFKGGTLSRREQRQLTRTVADIFRLVPFLAFMAIPFTEFLLPVIVTVFPNILPSTFATTNSHEEKLKKQLRMRLKLADFLHETFDRTVRDLDSDRSSVVVLLERVREGHPVSNSELLSVAKHFNDELTLDNLPRTPLIMLCQYMGLGTYGLSSLLLRYQLRRKFKQIKADDIVINEEGVHSLTLDEIRAASAERGMATSGLTLSKFQENLKNWIELSLMKDVPLSLLLLSRTFTLRQHGQPAIVDAIKSTLSSMDSAVVDEVLLELGEIKDPKKITAMFKRQNEIIKAEIIEKEKTTLTKPVSLAEISAQLESYASSSALDKEKENFRILKRKVDEDTNIAITSSSAKLQHKIKRMLQKLESEIEKTDKMIGEKLRLLEADSDGLMSVEDIARCLEGVLSQHHSRSEARKIAQLLDENSDGKVNLSDLLKLQPEAENANDD